MTPGKGKLPSLSAALAGIPAGVQTIGPWSGRRQLTVKFADEAETATIYTADALRGEVTRLMGRSRYHSLAVVGRDALAEVEFLAAAFSQKGALPLMLDHDGQRPEALERLLHVLDLVQVTLDGSEGAASVERIGATLRVAANKHVAHAVALVPSETLSDGPLLRIVEQVHEASADTQIVLHPIVERGIQHDRRWGGWLQQAMAVHADVRLLPRWPMSVPASQAGAQNAGTGNR
jgi:pyruvate-formate lyase-activating enzyme